MPNMETQSDTDSQTQPPFDAGWLDVGEGHALYYEQCGRRDGPPVLFLHGGPGSGCTPRQRQWFDLQRQRVVFFDQRGCGRSRPRGSVEANTSAHLVADIERLRRHLGVTQWLVVGGSWGAGLALAYAAAHPDACTGLLLRAVFLGRDEDVDWFFQGARQLLPAAWDRLAQQAPQADRAALLVWLARGLDEAPQALHCALAWEAWEASLTRQTEVPARSGLTAQEAAALLDKYRVQSHYLRHGCFWREAPLLQRLAPLAALPSLILHGRQDWICRPQAAWDLHRSLPASRLHWVAQAGHNPYQAGMAQSLRTALALHATHGDFSAWDGDAMAQESHP